MTDLLFVTYAYPPLFYPRALQISLLARALSPKHSLKVIAADFGKKSDALLPLCAPCPTVRVGETALAKRVNVMKGDRVKRFIIPDDMYLNLRAFRNPIDGEIHDGLRLVTFGQPMSMHLLGLYYKRHFPEIRWTAHFSDPWNHEGYSTSKGIAKLLNRGFEASVYKTADRLIFTSQETIDSVLSDRYEIYKEKARYVPHGFDPALYEFSSQEVGNFLRIGYFGTFYGNRQPYTLFEALRLLKAKNEATLKNVKICFYGPGSAFTESTKGIDQYLEFSDGVDFLKSLQLAVQMDGLLVIDAPAETSVFFPSKLADYIGANRPIFGITPINGTSARILSDLNMPAADPLNAKDIASTLETFIEGLRTKTLVLNSEARERYSSENVAREFIDAVY